MRPKKKEKERERKKIRKFFSFLLTASPEINHTYNTYCSCITLAVGWSDLVLFSIYENLHISVDQVYF